MENKIFIRPIQAEDNVILASIIRNIFIEFDAPRQGTVYSDPTTDDLYSLFQQPGAIGWVAELNGEVAGCGGIYPTPGLPEGCCEFVKFYLAPQTRGKGVGQLLMQQCMASARDLGYREVYLESLPHFERAVSLYRKLGFETLSAPLGHTGHFGCPVWMLKRL